MRAWRFGFGFSGRTMVGSRAAVVVALASAFGTAACGSSGSTTDAPDGAGADGSIADVGAEVAPDIGLDTPVVETAPDAVGLDADGAADAGTDALDGEAADAEPDVAPDTTDASTVADAAVDGTADGVTDAASDGEAGTDAGLIPDGGVCVPGTKDCASSTVPRLCDTTGNWTGLGPCASATPACVDGTCLACVPSDKRCVGTTTETCDSTGNWGPATSCAFACTGAGVCSGSCVPTTMRCSGTTSQTCDDSGTWQDTTSCPFACTGAGVCSGSCVPGAMRCYANELWGSDLSQKCDDTGNWANTTCAGICTGAGVCSGVCTPNTKQCVSDQGASCDLTGNWKNVGGACNYGCDATGGTCACSRTGLTVSSATFTCPGSTIADSTSGLTWEVTAYSGASGATCAAVASIMRNKMSEANATTWCSGKVPTILVPSGFSSRLPTQAELTALLAMQAPSTCASGFDGDPALQGVMNADYYWTSTPGPAGGFVAVSFADGTVSTTQTSAYFICVQ